jgi:hypothetical protein
MEASKRCCSSRILFLGRKAGGMIVLVVNSEVVRQAPECVGNNFWAGHYQDLTKEPFRM